MMSVLLGCNDYTWQVFSLQNQLNSNVQKQNTDRVISFFLQLQKVKFSFVHEAYLQSYLLFYALLA